MFDPNNRQRITTALMQGGPGAAGPQQIPTEGGMMPATLRGDDDKDKQVLPPWLSMGLGGMLINGLGSMFNHDRGSSSPQQQAPGAAPEARAPIDFGAAGVSPGQMGRIGRGISPMGARRTETW
jgi:hypothetical protein